MKKKVMSVLSASVMAASLLSGIPAMNVYADGTMVVSIGADLTEEQKTAILKYFGIYGNTSVQTITVTNADERSHLASYIPSEQIGTRTISCALVKPTTSGGIQVKTANLNYVTSNMIASNLATCGVTNCQAIAAAPFEVSGTGALTGVLMAYENATGTEITQEAKNLSAQEISVTQDITNSTDNQQIAQQIVNDVKMQVIEGTVVDDDSTDNSVTDNSVTVNDNSVDSTVINNIVNNVVENYTTSNTTNVSLSDEDIQKLTDLATEIAKQSYSKGTMDALAQIQSNLETQTGASSTDATQQAEEAAAQDSTEETDAAAAQDETESVDIFSGTDVTQLNGGDTAGTKVTGTDQAVISNDTAEGAQDNDANIASAESETTSETTAEADESGIVITTQDSGTFSSDGTAETAADAAASETTAETAAETDASGIVITTQDSGTISSGETADTAAQSEMPAESTASTEAVTDEAADSAAAVTITADNADQFSTSFLNEDNTAAYVPSFALAIAQDDLVPVSGSFTVSDSNGTVLGTADLSDASAVTAVTSGSIVDTFKGNHGWSQFTGLFFEVKGPDGTVITPSDGTYTVTLNGTFAQTADVSQTDGAPAVAVDLENVQLNTSSAAGFTVSSGLSSLMPFMEAAGTVSFPEDGSAAYALISAADGDDTAVSTPTGDGSVTPDSPDVSLTFASAGLKQINISFYASADDAAAGAEPVSAMSFFIPVKA